MASVFQITGTADEDHNEVPDARGATRRAARLRDRLHGLLGMPEVRLRLEELAGELWAPDSDRWGTWLVDRAHETLAEALLLACAYLAPRHAAADTLLVDLSSGMPDAPPNQVWITESTLGGAGVIEALVREYASDPRTLFTAIEAALAPSDLEVTATGLERFVQLVTSEPDVAAAVSDLRREQDHTGRERARVALQAQLAHLGLGVDHSLAVALNHRVLRQGTDSTSDALIADLLVYWHALERRLGIAIDQRVFCFLAAAEPLLRPRLQQLIAANTGNLPDTSGIVALLSGILWPRSAEVRGRSLESYSPFRDRGRTDAALVQELLFTEQVESIVFGSDRWTERLANALAQTGSARLTADRDHELALHLSLYGLLATPVNVDFLQFYPAIDQAARDDAGISVTFVLRELVS
jgi:hypothetical protein